MKKKGLLLLALLLSITLFIIDNNEGPNFENLLLSPTLSPFTTDYALGSVCGNGILERGEECDDGNKRNGDGCSKYCRIETDPTLVAQWEYEGNTQDTTTNNNDLSCTSCPTITTNANFNGNQWLEITDNNLVDEFPSKNTETAEEFTIATELYLDPTATGVRAPLVTKQGEEGNPDRGIVFMIENDGKLALELWESPTTFHVIKSPTTIKTGINQHVAATYKKANGGTATLYINGVAVQQETNIGNYPQPNTNKLKIGAYEWNSKNKWHYKGTLDDTRIYKRALTQTEIATLASQTTGGPICGDGTISAPQETCDPPTSTCNPPYGGSCQYCDTTCNTQTIQGPSCGDGICQEGQENSASCSQDCYCGNGVCESTETMTSCPGDCLILTKYVTVTGAGTKDGSSWANALNLQNAITDSKNNPNTEIVYLLATGSYGSFSYNGISNTAWKTFKAAPGANVVIGGISVINPEGQQKDVRVLFEGMESTSGTNLQWSNHVTLNNMEIHGPVTSPYGPPTQNCGRYLSGGGALNTIASNYITLSNSEVYDFFNGVTLKGSHSKALNNIIYGIGEDSARIWMDCSEALYYGKDVLYEDITFEGNEIYHVGDCYTDSTGVHPDVFQIYYASKCNLKDGSGTVIASYKSEVQDVHIKNNYLHDAYAQGIHGGGNYATQVKNLVIEGNFIKNIVMQSMPISGGANMIIRHNTIFGGIHVEKKSSPPSAQNIQITDNIAKGSIYTDADIQVDKKSNNIYDLPDGTWFKADPYMHSTSCQGELVYAADGVTPLCNQPNCDVTASSDGKTIGAKQCI